MGVVEVVIELAFVALVTGLEVVVVVPAKNSYQKLKTYFKVLRDYYRHLEDIVNTMDWNKHSEIRQHKLFGLSSLCLHL